MSDGSEVLGDPQALLLTGRECADGIIEEVRKRTESLTEQKLVPGLALVTMGDDPINHRQIDLKVAAAKAVGFYCEKHVLPEMASQAALDELLQSLSRRRRIHGIFLQEPLPRHINRTETGSHIALNKDIDLYSVQSLGRFYLGTSKFQPAMAAAAIRLLRHYSIKPAGKVVAMLGLGLLASQPLALMMTREHATVTVCHMRSADLKAELSRADIIIAGINKPRFVRWDMVSEGAVVIDLGQNIQGDRVIGDVDSKAVRTKASALTPVPGGVGPVIIAVILENTLAAAESA